MCDAIPVILKQALRIPFTFKKAHPFSFIGFFRKSPMLRNIGLFTMLSEAPNFEGYNGLFQVRSRIINFVLNTPCDGMVQCKSV